ncbi:hypothetical protein B566_EDAN006262 [Ephemera danica]|nr:hypothetical protein B566_EDAN006262 [Ephemera danica]
MSRILGPLADPQGTISNQNQMGHSFTSVCSPFSKSEYSWERHIVHHPFIIPGPKELFDRNPLLIAINMPLSKLSHFNFVGRILGPRGMTAKQLEQETGCKIMVRGRGSMRDKKKEEQNRGKPNWEHLNDELHVLITVEDTENRAQLKLQRAVDEVKRLLIPADGEDELKKRQLMELAIINGTYRDSSIKSASVGEDPTSTAALVASLISAAHHRVAQPAAGNSNADCIDTTLLPHVAGSDDEWRCLALVAAAAESQRLLGPGGVPGLATPLRTPPTPLGAPLILSPRMQVTNSAASHLLNGSAAPPPLMSPADHAGLIYTPYATAADYANYASLTSPLLTEYTAEHAAVGHQYYQPHFSTLLYTPPWSPFHEPSSPQNPAPSGAAAAAKQRRHLGQLREHPYQRAGAMS